MNPVALARMQKRVAQVRARAQIRRFEYRQRNHSKGVWDRLRRVLVDAGEAYAIDENDAAALIQAGATPLAIGKELHPERTFFFLSKGDAHELRTTRLVALHLEPVLREPYLVLVRM